jgi:elongation factor Ts
MAINLKDLQKLRTETKCGVMDCRQALEASDGNMEKAEIWLKEKGLKSADKRADRETSQGFIEAYAHGDGHIVAIVELTCETDFVSQNEEFRKLAHDLAMQVAAMNPENVEALLKQGWIRDDKTTIDELVKQTSSKFGENMKVRRIARFELGETIR